jgi:circadian clock protein KaiC
LEIYELSATEAAQQLDRQQTIFPTAEVELNEVTGQLVDVLRQKRPERVVIDSVTELRMLSQSRYRYRHQMLALSHVLDEIKATALFTDRLGRSDEERVMDSLVHGIIRLERRQVDYGSARRRLEVHKMRGIQYQDEWHDFTIERGGLAVYPQPRVSASAEQASWERISSGLESVDLLVGGGLEMGSACLIAGASGTGKSTVANLYVHSALQQGIATGVFLFDERPETLYKRTADLGMPLYPYAEQGLLKVQQIETGEVSPGHFSHLVRQLVEKEGARVLLLDSLTGYLRAMPDENLVMNQMHDLLNLLSRQGVLSLLVVTHHGLVGEGTQPGLDLSYVADTMILLRHFEAEGALRQAISVVKKRHSGHEKTIREIKIRPGSVRVGRPLVEFRGVLSGVPIYEGKSRALLERDSSGDEQT